MIWAGFVIGLMGSMHCLGMCGPLHLSWRVTGLPGEVAIKRLALNFGRVLSYGMLGLGAGLTGQVGATLLQQQNIALAGGAMLIIMAVIPATIHVMQKRSARWYVFHAWFKRALGQNKPANTISGQLLAGMLNGLLPCGMVYMALVGAVATGNVYTGAGFMIFFGLGTMPAMLGLGLAQKWLVTRFSSFHLKGLKATLGILVGLLFMLRGMDLGIPYISPALTQQTEVRHLTAPPTIYSCHKPTSNEVLKPESHER